MQKSPRSPRLRDAEPITVIAWASAIAHAIEAAGGRSEYVFKMAGVSYDVASNPEALLPTRIISDLFELGAEELQDPAFGLKVATQVHAGSFHALGYWLFSSQNLEHFCLKLRDFFEVHSDNVRHEVHYLDDVCQLRCIQTNPHITPIAYDAWLGSIVYFCRVLRGPSFYPSRVFLRHAVAAGTRDKYARYFRCPVIDGADNYAIEFPREQMHVRLKSSTFSLAERNEDFVIDYLSRLHAGDVVSRVRAALIRLLPNGDCSKAAVASELFMTPRSLHNRLREQGTSYQEILDEVRQRLAMQYAVSTRQSMIEIAGSLGFSSNASFCRAFRRWTGSSPSEYRDRAQQEAARRAP